MTLAEERPEFPYEASGFIESDYDVILAAELSATVKARLVEEGDTVESGEAIVQLDDELVALADARARAMYEEALLVPTTPAARARDLRLAAEQTAARLRKTTIRAPRRSRVERFFVDDGQWVGPGTPVVRLVDLETLRVAIDVPEERATLIRPGLEATFTVDAWGPNEFRARVHRVSLVADPPDRRFRIELRVARQPRPRPLPVGSFARVRIPIRTGESILPIAKEAVVRRFGRPYCFVVREIDGRSIAVATPIVVDRDPSREDRFNVRRGLKAGDVVVLGPLLSIRDGDAVELVAPSPTSPADGDE